MDDSPFNRLPAELRNEIFHLAVHEPSGIVIRDIGGPSEASTCGDPDGYTGAEKRYQAPVALTMTCREIRAETKALFYAVNEFSFHMWSLFKAISFLPYREERRRFKRIRDWLDMIGTSNAAHITTIIIQSGHDFEELDPNEFHTHGPWQSLHDLIREDGLPKAKLRVKMLLPRFDILDWDYDDFEVPLGDRKEALRCVEARRTYLEQEFKERVALKREVESKDDPGGAVQRWRSDLDMILAVILDQQYWS